ncbi:hypothetical protein [Actinomadura sp. 9N215]|uniref:hypothetical protein n=1 Tax=Actinomadura sp. 9N215 TaxID=3375150 RepID=UPI0037B395D8
MIWLTWRQHRVQFLSGAVVLAVLALAAYLTRMQITDFSRDSGLTSCLASGGDCVTIAHSFDQRFTGWLNTARFLIVLPLLIGFFWGAPLVAREFEQNTHRLVWNQTIGRARWLSIKLGIMILATALIAGVTSLLLAWWFKPFQDATALGRVTPDAFDLVGIAPIGYALFAVSLGVAAGAVLGRSLLAMGVTLIGFVTVRFAVSGLRVHFMPTLSTTYPVGGTGTKTTDKAWVISRGYVDGQGDRVSLTAADRLCRRTAADYEGTLRCLRERGFKHLDKYHPDNHFWSLQAVETAVFSGLAVLLFAFTIYWIMRRFG